MPDSINKNPLRIAIGSDSLLWHEKFAAALQEKIDRGYSINYKIINLENHDWIEAVKDFDIIIWKPSYMGPKWASLFKEKIYFLEYFLGKLVVPNYNNIWHFESKIAQSYVFAKYNIYTPNTFVSFNYHDALTQLNHANKPLVFKKYYGAGSKNVWLEEDPRKAAKYLSTQFCQQLWHEAKKNYTTRIGLICSSIFKRWFWYKLYQKLFQEELTVGAVYWQEFIPGNPADLRITCIGDKYAYGYWRRNRKNDFRASGSGLLDYDSPIPEIPLKDCLAINRKLGFDSMAYDIIFTSDSFVITEMCYAYIDSFLYNCVGYYEMMDDEKMIFKKGHVWPQQLWIEWALHKAVLQQVLTGE